MQKIPGLHTASKKRCAAFNVASESKRQQHELFMTLFPEILTCCFLVYNQLTDSMILDRTLLILKENLVPEIAKKLQFKNNF